MMFGYSPLNKLRFFLTRLMFSLMGLRINRWRSEIELFWSLTEDEREEFLEENLSRQKKNKSQDEILRKVSEIEKFEVMAKQNLREHQSETGAFDKLKFFRHTAGTTGEPVNIFLNRNELGRMLAVRDFCLRHHGLKVGDREARLWGQQQNNPKTFLYNLALNRRVFYPVGPEAKEEVKLMLRWKPAYVYGYASLVLEASRIMDSEGLQPDCIKSVICTAENILPAQKDYISKVFNAPVIEEYGSSEFDIIAFECRYGHRHLVNPWLIVEENNGSCAITDIKRESQNLIRYELGDSLKLKRTECFSLGSPTVLEEIGGRSINQFAYASENQKFHAVEFAHTVDRYMKKFQEDFSFIVYQERYGVFSISTHPPPSHGLEHLCRYVEQVISSKTLVSVTVEPFGQQEGFFQVKQSYFVQKL